eukprot:CAMPEP_0202338066 /NCGR_PEP_ID=MMETSP1126-20121109/493_1 /ASSEMBLY_ACC=CAM_ASM_000457 /TAXON_ID=3047 /ORGANISM="Dunaliella tertiolecta, Strain CCMP1320" /LENGTH=68 /DNA_ID=CAMNT_0048928375 /DNA_START=591 /DNA_END=794 /DNA_ORIENTATION=-
MDSVCGSGAGPQHHTTMGCVGGPEVGPKTGAGWSEASKGWAQHLLQGPPPLACPPCRRPQSLAAARLL